MDAQNKERLDHLLHELDSANHASAHAHWSSPSPWLTRWTNSVKSLPLTQQIREMVEQLEYQNANSRSEHWSSPSSYLSQFANDVRGLENIGAFSNSGWQQAGASGWGQAAGGSYSNAGGFSQLESLLNELDRANHASMHAHWSSPSPWLTHWSNRMRAQQLSDDTTYLLDDLDAANANSQMNPWGSPSNYLTKLASDIRGTEGLTTY